MMPGVGLYYWERKARGSRLIVCWVLYVMGALLWWLLSPFHSYRLSLYICLPWGMLVLWLWHEVGRTPPAGLSWVRHVDRVVTSLGLVVLAWLPILLTLQLIFSRALLHIRVEDSSMFPVLVSGDLVAVDRRVSRPERLSLGALVAVECKGVGPRVMRLIAYEPRQTLTVELDELGGVKRVEREQTGDNSGAQGADQEPQPVATSAETIQSGLLLLDRILKARLAESDQIEGWLSSIMSWEPAELNLIRSLLWTQVTPISADQSMTLDLHLIAVRRYQDPLMKAKRLTVPRGQMLLLPDLRDSSSRAMSCAGITSPRRLLGEVVYIQDQDRDAYARRRGLSLLR